MRYGYTTYLFTGISEKDDADVMNSVTLRMHVTEVDPPKQIWVY